MFRMEFKTAFHGRMTKNMPDRVQPKDFAFHQRYWETGNCGITEYNGRVYISRTGDAMEDFDRLWQIYADDVRVPIGTITRSDVKEDGESVYYTPYDYDATGVGQTLTTGLTSFKAALAAVINADQLRRHAQIIEDAAEWSDH